MTKSDVQNLNSKQCVQVIVEDNKDNDEVIVPDILAVKEQKQVSVNEEVDFYENEVDPDKKEVDPDKKDVHSNKKEIDQDEKEIDHNEKEDDPEDTETEKQCDLHDANSKYTSGYLDDISLTQELCEDSNTDSSVSSKSTYSTTNQSHEKESVKSPKQTVSRIEIPSTKVTADHVRKLFPSNRNKLTKDMIQQKLKRYLKGKVMQWLISETFYARKCYKKQKNYISVSMKRYRSMSKILKISARQSRIIIPSSFTVNCGKSQLVNLIDPDIGLKKLQQNT